MSLVNIEDATTGMRKKVNRSNLKLSALPFEELPSVADIPRHLLGLKNVRQWTMVPTRKREFES